MRVKVSTRSPSGVYGVTRFRGNKKGDVTLFLGSIAEDYSEKEIPKTISGFVRHEAFHYHTPKAYRQTETLTRKRREAQEKLAEAFDLRKRR